MNGYNMKTRFGTRSKVKAVNDLLHVNVGLS